MPEYVYALHDFLPENEDEVSFSAGDRIEIVERDDMYGDGWWQGRNLAGRIGLFPVSYTTPAAPPAVPVPSSSPEGPESGSARPEVDSNIIAPIPKQGLASFLNGNHDFAEEHGVMEATLTDVQQAIEQLGRDNGDNDGGRSFSFASTRDDRDTDTDFDLSDMDGTDGGDDLEGWHKGARMKLAEKARRAVEEAEKLDAMMGGLGISSERRTAPPIEVELSDESDDDEVEQENFTSRSVFQGIPEEDEEEAEAPSVPTTIAASPLPTITSDTDKDDVPTATRAIFPHIQHQNEADNGPLQLTQHTRSPSPSPQSPSSPTTFTNVLQSSKHSSIAPPKGTPSSSPISVPASDLPPKSPSPPPPPVVTADVSPPLQPIEPPTTTTSTTTSVTSFPAIVSPPITTPSTSSVATMAATSAPTSVEKKKETHPSEWTLEDVVEWLKSKGFDQDVCDKFTEQEITGDVLLELDATLLKTEIGIMAFGKRVRIANAIADLRRPPSVSYSDHPEPSPKAAHTPITPLSQVHSRTQSQSHSHHSFPGSNLHHTYSQSIQSSLASPLGFPGGNNVFVYPNGNGNAPNAIMQPGSAGGFTPALVESPLADINEQANGSVNGNGSAVGLGIANGGFLKPRPTQLSLSPSDGALKVSATLDALTALQPRLIQEDEDRGHMSDGDVAPKSMRRKLFGKSQDSTGSSFRLSKDMSPVASPTSKDSEKEDKKEDKKEKEKDKDSNSTSSLRHGKSKKSLDAGKGGDRLSIFGGTFGGSLGKNRKPPPSADDATIYEKTSMFSRLHSGTVRKSSSNQPRSSTPTNSSKTTPTIEEASPKLDKNKGNKDSVRDPALLRKRTTATSPTVPSTTITAATAKKSSTPADTEKTGVDGQKFKPGKSILAQIGVPDHSGWMRKRGDRYNSWKNRYFVLKGPHMYCLRSDSKSETKIKGYIHIVGYKVSVDENLDPGRYGFRIDHDNDKTHYFSSDEKGVVRDWMKAIMKATIDRDYSRPVVSSCNIPTIPLTVAQAMNPAPRPPSPSARAATQRSYMREDTNQLSTRDAQVLSIGLTPPTSDEFGDDIPSTPKVAKTVMTSTAPPRPSREMRRSDSVRSSRYMNNINNNSNEEALIEWANTHLPSSLHISSSSGPLYNGLALLRLAESIKGVPSSPPVPDSAFPKDEYDDKLDGLFRLFDYLLDNDVKMGSVSINDVKLGKREKILQLLRALRNWEERRKQLVISLSSSGSLGAGGKSVVGAGAFIAPSSWA